ncbi:MAG: hypothetical protein WKF76_10670 [Nocardioidaceae bacterium]
MTTAAPPPVGVPLVRLSVRSAVVLTAVSLIGLVAYAWPFFVDPGAALDTSHSGDAPWFFVVLLPLLAAVVVAELSSGGMDAKAVAMLGMLAAIGAALRALGPGAAGLEPSFIVIVLGGRVFGRGFGFVLGALTIFAGGLVTGGVGPWLPFQMFAAGLGWPVRRHAAGMARAGRGRGAGDVRDRRGARLRRAAQLVVLAVRGVLAGGYVRRRW